MTFMTFHILGMSSSPLTTSYFSEGWRKTTNQVQIVLVPNDSVLGSQLFLTRDDNWWAVWAVWAVCYTLNTSWHPEKIFWPPFHDQNVSKNEQIVTISNPHLPLFENWIPHSIWSARSCSVWNLPGIRASNLQTHPTIKLVGCIYIYISHYVSSRICPMISHVLFLNPHYSPIFCRFFPRANPLRYRGSIQLNEFKAVMLAALRSLVSRSRGGLRWASGCGSWRLALTVQNISYHLYIHIYIV